MNEQQLKKLIRIVSQSAIYVPFNCEGIRVNYWDDWEEIVLEHKYDDACFYGTGEESGEEYMISYSEIDLEKDMFYELKLVDTADL